MTNVGLPVLPEEQVHMADIKPASILGDIRVTKTGVLLIDPDCMFREVLITVHIE